MKPSRRHHRSSAPSVGARLAVAAAAALVVAGSAGRDLYVSSAANESLQVQLANTCGTDAGVSLFVAGSADVERVIPAAAAVPNTQAPLVQRSLLRPTFRSITAAGNAAPAVPLELIDRPGQFGEVGPGVEEPPTGAMLLPDWYVATGAVAIGDRVDVFGVRSFRVRSGDGSVRVVDLGPDPIATLVVAGTYPEIPFRPEPSFWCGWRDAIRPTVAGDRQPPMALVSSATMDSMPTDGVLTVIEVRPDGDGLRRDEGAALADDLRGLFAVAYPDLPPPSAADPFGAGLATLVGRAGSVGDFVERTVDPAFAAAVLTAGLLLVGAGRLVARDRHRELRLRALRGMSGPGLAVGQAGWLIPTTFVGAASGLAVAVLGVRVLGPTPEIDSAASRAAVLWAVAGWVVAAIAVAVVIGASGASLVDARTTRRHRRWMVGMVPVALVAAAVVSFRRLDDLGGVRRSGASVAGGDLVAQAFPLLGALSIIVFLAVGGRFLLARVRGVGGALPVPVLLGVRRLSADPAIAMIVVAMAALATSAATQATLLTASVQDLLDDKAAVFVGADLAVEVLEEPADLAGLGEAATVVTTLAVAGNPPVTILGVDASSFADVATFRSDASPRSLADLLGLLDPGPSDRWPALVVGDLPGTDTGTDLALGRGRVFPIDVVARPSFFPRFANGATLVIVARDAIVDLPLVRTAVWVHSPRGDAPSLLQQRGVRVAGTIDAATVFDSTDFLSTEWAYAAFTGLGVLIAAVALLAQTLVIEARSASRRAAHVLGRRMGVTARAETVALAIEVGAPLYAGVAIGALAGWGTARAAIGRLDPLRNLQPPALLSVHLAVLVAAFAAATVALVAVVAFGLARTVRADPMDAMRGNGG